MTSIQVIISISLIASLSLILKKYACEYSLVINIALSLIVIAYLISNILPIFNHIKSLINVACIPEKYISMLFKSLGICFLTQFASDSCKDAGEISLSSKIEMIGKMAVITTALPLFDELTQTALGLLGAK